MTFIGGLSSQIAGVNFLHYFIIYLKGFFQLDTSRNHSTEARGIIGAVC